MKLWWRAEIKRAKDNADRAEQEQARAVLRRKAAEQADNRIKKVEIELRRELVRNGFAEALRSAFGSHA